MRRSYSSGYGYEPVPSTSHNAIEKENNQKAVELDAKIGSLKSLSLDISNEVRYQQKLISRIDDDCDRTGGSLSSSVSRVLKMAKAGHNRIIIYLFFFSLGVILVLWFVMRYTMSSKDN